MQKDVVINSAKVIFEAFQTQGDILGDPDYTHSMALMQPDDHWSADPDKVIQADTTYSLPSFSDTVRTEGRQSNGTLITQTSSSGSHEIGTTGDPAFQTIGCTIQLPAGSNCGQARFWISRADSELPDNPDIRVVVYNTAGGFLQSRGQFAIDSPLGIVSDPIPYGNLPFVGVGGAVTATTFTFPTNISGYFFAKWWAFMLEGDWFHADYAPNQYRINYHHVRGNSDQSAYNPLTFGSTVIASKDPAVQFKNSLSHYYPYMLDVPALYKNNSTDLLTTPFKRYIGNVVTSTDCGPWTAGEDKSYGSATSGADEIFTGFESEIQDWISGPWWSPTNPYMGLLTEIEDVTNIRFQVYTHVAIGHNGMRLVIDATFPSFPVVIRGGDITRNTVETSDVLQCDEEVEDITRNTAETADVTRQAAETADVSRQTAETVDVVRNKDIVSDVEGGTE